MKEKKTWNEFQKTGLFLFVNQFLQIFGWALVYEQNQSGEIVNCYPAKVNWRGFNHETQGEAYTNLTNHIAENIEELKKDVDEK